MIRIDKNPGGKTQLPARAAAMRGVCPQCGQSPCECHYTERWENEGGATLPLQPQRH